VVKNNGDNLSVSLKQKYDRIIARERALANSVARSVVAPRPFGVWDIMIPMVFILNFMKNKQMRELFIQNYIFTKQLALQAAFDILKKGQSREEVLARIVSKTGDILASEAQEIYSNEIRREQMKEMDLLIDHYRKLLESDGDDYSSFVANAYQNGHSYSIFLEQLMAAEKKVSQAAQQTLGDKADTAALSRIEAATARLRMAEVEKIFGTQGSH
jgi:Fe2+ transport system protein B